MIIGHCTIRQSCRPRPCVGEDSQHAPSAGRPRNTDLRDRAERPGAGPAPCGVTCEEAGPPCAGGASAAPIVSPRRGGAGRGGGGAGAGQPGRARSVAPHSARPPASLSAASVVRHTARVTTPSRHRGTRNRYRLCLCCALS